MKLLTLYNSLDFFFIDYKEYIQNEFPKRRRTRRMTREERGIPLAVQLCIRNNLSSYLTIREKVALECTSKGLYHCIFKKHEKYTLQCMTEYEEALGQPCVPVHNLKIFGMYWSHNLVREMVELYLHTPDVVNLGVRTQWEISAAEYCIYFKHYKYLPVFQRAKVTCARHQSTNEIYRHLLRNICVWILSPRDTSTNKMKKNYTDILDALMYFVRQYCNLGIATDIDYDSDEYLEEEEEEPKPGLLVTYFAYSQNCELFRKTSNSRNSRAEIELKDVVWGHFRKTILEYRQMGMKNDYSPGSDSFSPLLLAMQYPDSRYIDLLIDIDYNTNRDVWLDEKDGYPMVPSFNYEPIELFMCIHYGIQLNHLDKFLKRYPEWINRKYYGFTSLGIAVGTHRWKTAKLLLKHGANATVTCSFYDMAHGEYKKRGFACDDELSLIIYCLSEQFYYFLAELFLIPEYEEEIRNAVKTFTKYQDTAGYKYFVEFMNSGINYNIFPMPDIPACIPHPRVKIDGRFL